MERRRCPPVNLLLQSLSISDAGMLLPMLSRIRCGRGELLQATGSAPPMIYFPETLIATLAIGNNSSSIGMIGYEGVIGWPALIGESDPALKARVMFDGGEALAISAQRLQIACFASPTLMMSLLRFVQTFAMQMAASAHSAMGDSVGVRLCA